jgi:hypothetical protein
MSHRGRVTCSHDGNVGSRDPEYMHALSPQPIGPFATRGEYHHTKLYDGSEPPSSQPRRRFRFRWFTRRMAQA